jgi:predicted lysophospholipase L1 biosynthesis ABC-type transport system permease subunit
MNSPKVGAHVKCKAYQRRWLQMSISFRVCQKFISSCSCELTSTTATMASQGNQVVALLATKLVLPITGDLSSEPANKKQKKEA